MTSLLVALGACTPDGSTKDLDTDTDTDVDADTDTDADADADSDADTDPSTGDTAAGSTGDTGGVALADLVPGTWNPVSITQGGVTTPIDDDPTQYLILDPGGDLTLGCGAAPAGTWVFDSYAPYPAIATLQVDLGFPVSWYLLTLDATTMVYVEGGDQFDFARATCP